MPRLKLAIVGRPNVGKSTLFNRLAGKKLALVDDQPGVTRDRREAHGRLGDLDLDLIDTAGFEDLTDESLEARMRAQTEAAIADADVILFLIDARVGVTPMDERFGALLRRTDKPVILGANKAEGKAGQEGLLEAYSLGLGEPLGLSGEHGEGMGDLYAALLSAAPGLSAPDSGDEGGDRPIHLAIIGRPNAGKSTLVNALLGEERMLTGPEAGITRDSIAINWSWKGRDIRLIDTAGIRRRGKIQASVEYYMVNRAEKAIARCECAMVVVNGEEGLTDGDKRVMKLAHDAGKACVIAVNKWDVKEPPNGHPKKQSQLKKDFTKIFRDQIPELAYAPIVFTSAKENAGLEPALDTVLSALESYNFRISTGQLNRLVQDAIFDKPHVIHGRPFKVYYSTQVATCPPTFVLFCNDPDLMHFSYQRYLLNKIRALFPLQGTPIRLFARSSHKKNEED
jgi:GTP-binding protein